MSKSLGGSLYPVTDLVAAFAGGAQVGATLLQYGINRITTVVTAGDSVLLPAAALGMAVRVVNDTANPITVYTSGTDTVNGLAATAGATQPPSSVYEYWCPSPGIWRVDPVGGFAAGSFPTVLAVNGLTAHAGGGQGSAVPLTGSINRVTTVGTAADSVVLPAAVAGMQITVSNAAAVNSMNCFPAGTDQINALGASAAFAIAAGKTAVFSAAVAGQWHAVLSA